MPLVPAGFTIPSVFSGAGIPSGWERVSELDGRYPKGAAAGADPGVQGGAETHAHTSPAHTHTISSHTHAGGNLEPDGTGPTHTAGANVTIAALNHSHTFGTFGAVSGSLTAAAATWQSQPNDMSYRDVIWLRSLGTTMGIPPSFQALWDQATAPSGWSMPISSTQFLKGAVAGGDAGSTGGFNTHNHAANPHTHPFGAHTHSGVTSGTPNSTSVVDGLGGFSTTAATQTHTHAVTVRAQPNTAASGSATSANTGTSSHEPPYIRLGLVNNASGQLSFPIGVIGCWLGLRSALPLSLHELDGEDGTLDARGRYVRMATISTGEFQDLGETGGATTHTHTDPATHTHNAAHTHQVEAGLGSAGTTISRSALHFGVSNVHNHRNALHDSTVSGSGGSTSGTGTQGVDSANHEPPHTTVIWVQYTGAIDVDVTFPGVGEVIEAPTFTVEWDLVGSSGTQATRRVRIYGADQSSLVHDSGITATATEEYAVPGGIGLRTGRTYHLQVSVVDTDGLPGDSALVPFSTSWVPPAAVTGLRSTRIGGIE